MKWKMLIVARWEFVERIKTKSFLIGLFLTPAIMVGFSVLPSMMMMRGDEESRTIAVYDGTGFVLDSLRIRLDRSYRLKTGEPNYRIQVIPRTLSPARAKEEADRYVLHKSAEASILIPPAAPDSLEFEYRASNVSNIRDIERFEQVISNLIAEHKLAGEGLDPRKVDRLTKRVNARTVRVTEGGEKESGFLEQFGLSYIFVLMLLMMVIQSGQFLVRSLVEEKSNRLVEVLVSSCSPMDLMGGKILGLSALGLAQLLLWSGMGIAALVANDVTTLPLEHLWLMILYFLLGYLLYSGVFVMFGTLASTEQEAQQITGYLTILLVIPIALAFFASQSPNATIIRFLSFIPFLTPAMMLLRIPILLPPLWEIGATLGVLILTVATVTWAAGKIFRIGILVTGKRPGFGEIFRWIRR